MIDSSAVQRTSPSALRTPSEAAAQLPCSFKPLNARVHSGALRYIVIDCGTKRLRRMFADPDLTEFIERQSRRDAPPCPSTATKARRSIHWPDHRFRAPRIEDVVDGERFRRRSTFEIRFAGPHRWVIIAIDGLITRTHLCYASMFLEKGFTFTSRSTPDSRNHISHNTSAPLVDLGRKKTSR
jgi:hypothetical protein